MNWWILKRHIHVSWLIAVASCGVVVGVIISQYITQGLFATLPWFLSGISLVLFGVWRSKLYAILFVLVGGLLIGFWRGGVDLYTLTPYKNIANHTAEIKGAVSEDPEIDKSGTLLIRLNVANVNNHKIGGKVWVSTATKLTIKRSDIVTVQGKVQQGFGSFSAAMYRAKILKAERPQPGDLAGQLRDWFAGAVRTAIPEPEASLGIGYLVGQRRSLPPELDEALQIAGLTHIVVASGYNLTILVRLARRLFEKISKYLSALAASSMIISFMAITGASPSMSRAGLVAGLSLLAWYYGRKFHPFVLLPFAAAITLLINPSFAWGDLGWQLSFAAFAGVMVVAPLAQRYFFGDKKPGTVRQILGETIAAQLVTLPILLLAFGQFSNVAIIANLLVLPFVPLAMLLTFVTGIAALLVPIFAGLAGLPAAWLLEYMTTTAQWLAKLPWAQSEVALTVWGVAGMYTLIVVLCGYMWWKTRFNLREANIIE